jgi:choline kinase
MGSRIRAGGNDLPKPLHKVQGVPLIKRTILTLASAGISRVGVVVGFRADLVIEALAGDPDYEALGIELEIIENPEYKKANGVSVLAAQSLFREPFLLSMADHIYDADIARRAAAADMSQADLVLCVDPRLDEIYDMDDATKVRTRAGMIVDIGKTIPRYDCVDCGVFAVGPALFDELGNALRERGDCSLSDGVARLAERQRARVVEIGPASFWQDVDTPDAQLRAESVLRGDTHLPLTDTQVVALSS